MFPSLARGKLRVLTAVHDKYSSEPTGGMILVGGNRWCRVVTIFIHVQNPISGHYPGHGKAGNVSAVTVLWCWDLHCQSCVRSQWYPDWNRFRCRNSIWDYFNPLTIGSRLGWGLFSLAFHIYSCASRWGPLRSVPCRQHCSHAEQQVHEIVKEPMPCPEGGEAGKNIWEVADVLRTSLLGKGSF